MGYKHEPMDSKIFRILPFLLLTLVTSTMVSCAFREDDVEEEKRKNSEQVAEYFDKRAEAAKINESNVKHDIIPNAEVGLYDIVLTWPESIPGVSIQIKGENPVFPEGNSYAFTAQSGDLVKVYMVALNQYRNPVDNYEFSIQVPKDLIVDRVMSLESTGAELFFKRIKFSSGGTLVSGLNDLMIKTEYLEVDNRDLSWSRGRFDSPHITTIELNTSTVSNHPYNGGKIRITAKKAVGELLINSIGLDGNDGAKGLDASQELDSTLNGSEPTYNLHRTPGMRGPDGNSPAYCKAKMTSSAGAGKQGHAGGAGQDGVDGGNTPLFILNVEDYQDLKVYILSRPGKGGRGGEGGMGGPGGLGAYEKIFDDKCKPMRSKKKADDGARGESGANGKNGKNGAVSGISGNIPADLIRNESWDPI